MLQITIKTDAGTVKVDLTAEEQKAFEYVALSPAEWIENAIRERVRRAVDEIITQHSDRQPQKLPPKEKPQIVRAAKIKSAAERQAESEAEVRKATKQHGGAKRRK